jgi:hypothetical protein
MKRIMITGFQPHAISQFAYSKLKILIKTNCKALAIVFATAFIGRIPNSS